MGRLTMLLSSWLQPNLPHTIPHRGLGKEEKDEDANVESDEEVNQVEVLAPIADIAPLAQVPAAKPIFVLSSDLKVANDLKFLVVVPAAEDLIKHSFNRGNNLGYSSKVEVDMASRQRVLEKKKAIEDELEKQSSDLILALPSLIRDQSNDVANLSTKNVKEFKDLLIMQGIQLLQQAVANSERTKKNINDLKKAIQRAYNLENELKKARSDLDDIRNVAEIATRDLYERQVANLHTGIFQEGWLTCLREIGTPSDHPTWTTLVPPLELPNPPAVYSPILLPGFNEEEYANFQPEGEEGDNVVVTQNDELVGGEGAMVVGDESVEAEGENQLEE
ncbi:hypothetical protein Acr_18g0007250 [Actinidia rufa]|uniref:Uncharacterized protein n=1 Tax=Actinidia rufa TaxID=165716 RepID=A0A7J0G6Z0_9ERIC|nr:hypothetical protein Acr_18g0007250 [Actinidia rufa]